MTFGLSCTPAAAERVFSLVDAMYGADQASVLADQVQAGVMQRYNKRSVRLNVELVSSSSHLGGCSCEDSVFTQNLHCVCQQISSQFRNISEIRVHIG